MRRIEEMGFIDELKSKNSNRPRIVTNILESDSAECQAIRTELEKMWPVYSDLADTNFIAFFNLEPESRYWEMYLGATLRKAGIEVSSNDSGPDIKVDGYSVPIWIEAIAPSQGDPEKADYLPDRPESGKVWDVPRDKIILRLTHALEQKRAKFAKYLAEETVAPDDCCVIAVSAGNLPYPMEDSLPYIVQAVYPIGHQYVTLDNETLEVVDSGRQHQPFVTKAGEKEIPKFAFLAEEYAQISALIFCAKGIGNTSENWGEDLILVHNAAAKVALSEGLLNCGVEYSVDMNENDGQLVWKNHNKS